MHLFRQQANIDTYLTRAANTYAFLERQTDLSPRNGELNKMLHGFVTDTMRPRSKEETIAILNAPTLREIAPGLRRLLGRAEYEMEQYCANAMIGNEPNAQERYASYPHFIYRKNYEALVASELHAMRWWIKQPPLKKDRESVAFVGAGPLPISAIMFHKRTGLPVTCVDSDERAFTLGRDLIFHLSATNPQMKDLHKHVHYVHAAGEDHDYVTHPIVFIASLVAQKAPVVMQIVRSSHTVSTTVIRTAEGLSTLLYQPEGCAPGQEEYNVYLTGKTRPTARAINSSLVYRFPPGKCWMRNKIEWQGQAEDMHVLRPQKFRMRTRPYDQGI